MKIQIPFIFGKMNWNDAFYRKNYRILFWNFQLIEELRKRGFWLVAEFNHWQYKEFKKYLVYKNTKWDWYNNSSHERQSGFRH